MCGISVVFNRNGLSREIYYNFTESLQKINHRGPDDEGIVLINTNTGEYKVAYSQIEGINNPLNPDVEKFDLALGHKRLSILDLSSAGHQPMKGNEGSWIVFNGEIYNYIEIKAELKLLGCNFRTSSDTEVILEAYRIWGKDCLNKFNGMWSILIWDASQKKIFISNDRFGVKPLYYHESNNGFVFVSETKQLKAYKEICLDINYKHVHDFLIYSYVDVDDLTMYNNVERFKKSHFILLDPSIYNRSSIKTSQIKYYIGQKGKLVITENDAVDKFRELLLDSVKIRMRSDVNFGFALSGGLDSSAILYMARNILQQEKMDNILLGFSAIFPGQEASDESKFVRIVSEDLPCKTVYSVPMEDFDFEAFERHVYHQEEPVFDTSVFAQWNIYQKVNESNVKILFNGQGADEVFAGYHHHFYRYCRQLLIKGRIPEYFNQVNKYAELKSLAKKFIHQTVFNELKLKIKMKFGISTFDHSLMKYWNEIDTLDEMLMRDFDTFQIPGYLRIDDRNSMAFSIESRHPFMDYRLVEFGYSLPNDILIKDGWQKNIIRKSMHEMPESIRYRKDKKGFTTPQNVWLNKYKRNFDEYLGYNKKTFGVESPSKDPFKNYVLGAWLKVNHYQS